jgi:hypothetical protein
MQRVGKRAVIPTQKILASSVVVTIDSKHMEVGDLRAMPTGRALGLHLKVKRSLFQLDPLIRAQLRSANLMIKAQL